MVHDVLECLVRRVDDQWIAVVTLHDNCVFDAKVVVRELLLLPQYALLGLAEELSHRESDACLHVDLIDRNAPVCD